MTRRTIIYLHSMNPVQASWAICEDEEIETSVLHGDLNNLSLQDKQNELIVVVPACDVLLTQTALPKMSRQRLLQALPFALEEQVVNDVGELHFALADQTAEGTYPVAIVATKKMDEWTELFRQYQLTPSQLYSSTFILPLVANSWTAMILPEGSTVRQSAWHGFGGENANFARLVELAANTATDKPECIHVYSTLPTPMILETTSIIINEIHLPEESWLETFPAWIDPSESINLLQGKYEPKRKTSATKKIWQWALSATLIWVALAFFFQFISFFILHHEASSVESKINVIYKNNFPNASSVVTPAERMQKKLASLEEELNTNYFLIMLAKTGSQLTQTSTVQLKNMEYREKQLTLNVTANKFNDMDELTRKLKEQGLQVKQTNAAVTGEQINASLLISRGTA